MNLEMPEIFRRVFVERQIALRSAAWLLLLFLGIVSVPRAQAQYASLLMDASTGQVLHETNADAIRYPASLTKMMTLYMVFDGLDSGRLDLQERIPISTHAASQSPTKLGLRPGQSITVENAILALVTKSANDIAAAIGEHLGGSESVFAALMTQRAHELGMHQTYFANASGLPDPQQVTTARDMAILALALLKDHPDRYHYFSTERFYYGGSVHPNHNRLLGTYDGLDGIKTGYTRASGFNLVASAQRGRQRLIGVVMGARSLNNRALIMTSLLDQGFAGDEVITAWGAPGSRSAGAATVAAASVASVAASRAVASRAVVSRDSSRARATQTSASRRVKQPEVAARSAKTVQSCKGSGKSRRCTATVQTASSTSKAQKVATASSRNSRKVIAKPAPAERATASAKKTGKLKAAPGRKQIVKAKVPEKPATARLAGKGKPPAKPSANLAEGKRHPSS